MKIKHLAVSLTAMVMFGACTDDLTLDLSNSGAKQSTLFTASIAEQDFYGSASSQTSATRAVGVGLRSLSQGFYDLDIEGNSEMKLAVTTVGGIFGKANAFADKGVKGSHSVSSTRGAMLTELRQEAMLVMETSRANGNVVVGEPYKATTSDGVSWTGSHIKDNGNAIERTLNAFYPYRENYTVNNKELKLSYVVPEAATEQCDLLYAHHEQGIASTQTDSVHLTFNHLLTAVRFKVGNKELPMSIIKRIEISGIHNQGSFDCTANAWTVGDAVGTASAELDFNVTGMSNTIINGGENTFMLLPQTLPSDAKVTVIYTDEDQAEQQFVAKLSSASHTATWQPGQSVTYTLMPKGASDEYILEVEQPEAFTHEGGTHNINVLSYKRLGDVITPVKWAVQSYSSDGGKTWLAGGSANVLKGLSLSAGEGYTDQPMLVGVTVAPAEQMTNVSHREILRYTPSLGQDGDAFDLSTHDYLNQPCACTTANCYVVDAPGTYRFPTAYGNGIVNGETNSKAYSDANFVDAYGQHVTAPMIQQSNGLKISRASLVWQDSEDLIRPEDIKLIDGGNAIQFTIRPENIAQGNATIAALDDNNVLWSWHIWVTDDKALLADSIPVDTKDGKINYFMPLNIGWCSTSTVSGSVGRELAVRITQPDEALNNRASFRITQHSLKGEDNQLNTQGNSPYYNWGRKDPFPGAETNEIVMGVDHDESNCAPKPFYQAGSETGPLGLHAEMHVEYGPNLGQAALAGAFLGANGFLTGVVVGRVFAALKKAYVASAPSLVKESAQPSASWAALEANAPANGWKVGSTILADGSTVPTITYADGSVKAFTYVQKVNYVLNSAGQVISQSVEDVLMSFSLTTPTAGSSFAMGAFSSIYLPTMAKGLTAMSVGQAVSSAFSGASLFSSDGNWLYEVKGHGRNVSYGISHPNVLFRNPVSWIDSPKKNLWNATQNGEDSKEEAVTKTIYDPSPAGYCVPSASAFDIMDDESTSVGMHNGMYYFPSTAEKKLSLPALGLRQFWNGCQVGEAVTNDPNTLIMFCGDQGYYWTASPAIEEKGYKEGGYCLNFKVSDSYSSVDGKTTYSPRIENSLKLQTSFAMPVRPVREK